MNFPLSSKIEYLLQYVQSLPKSQSNSDDMQNNQINDDSFHLLPPLSKLRDTNSNEFSIMSWNILIKDYHYRYYGYLEDEYKEWQYRLPRLQQTISDLNTDIICLQEAHLPSFKQDFGEYFIKNGNYEIILNDIRPNSKIKQQKRIYNDNDTPILFKKNKFKLIFQDFRTEATVALLQFNESENKQDIYNNYKQQEETIENDASCKQNKKKKKKHVHQQKIVLDSNKSFIWIVNVHLECDPCRPDTRFNQIKKIINIITNKTNEYKLNLNNKVYAIFAGDFNAVKGEVVDDLLLNGGLKWDYRQNGYDNVDIVKSKNKTDYKHKWKFNNAYDHIQKQKEIFTFYARDLFLCIDHFYYTSNNLKCLLCTQTVPLWLSTNKKLQCPNDKLVSDHLPIASMFKMIQC